MILGNSSNNIRQHQALTSLQECLRYNTFKNPPQEYVNQLVRLYNQGQFSAVIEQAELLTDEYPMAFALWNILGVSNVSRGMFDKAIEAFKKCISIKPNIADPYNNIGVAFKEEGKLDEAIQAFKKALLIKPDYAEVYYNTGATLTDQGKLDTAIEAYKRAVKFKPDYAEAYNNLGNIFKDQEKSEEAIEAYIKALSLKPDYAEAYFNIGTSLKGIDFKKANPSLQKIISILLDKKTYVRPQDIISSATSLLKEEKKLKKHLDLQKIDDEEFDHLEVISDLCDLPLLLNLMSVCPIVDADIEKLFIKIRANLLMSAKEIDCSSEVLKFQSALALQCFTNEYIYEQSQDEEKALRLLEELVKQNMNNNNQPSTQMILCLSSYKPLNHYEWSNSLNVTNGIKDVFTRQVEEPHKEANLNKMLPLFGYVNNKTSLKVRAQYEVNPYPKWVNLKLQLKPVTISKVISDSKLKLFDYKIKDVLAPDILIAGCGTGQHSIETAARFKDAKVLAVDLSKSSLSYAKRKTDELIIQNIDYLHADILDLDKIDRQFDIVESVGVLHHMNKPITGWRILKDCLKPGGLMKIGLYSEFARQNIVKIRKEISKEGLGSSNMEMKSFRNMIMKSDKNHHKLILNSPDFYSMSTLKDLLFHVQEHRFTLIQIKDCLSTLGLKFCGFEAKKIVSHFKKTNTGESDIYNLDKWQAYEEAYPSTFAGMYQFWCQKIV